MSGMRWAVAVAGLLGLAACAEEVDPLSSSQGGIEDPTQQPGYSHTDAEPPPASPPTRIGAECVAGLPAAIHVIDAVATPAGELGWSQRVEVENCTDGPMYLDRVYSDQRGGPVTLIAADGPLPERLPPSGILNGFHHPVEVSGNLEELGAWPDDDGDGQPGVAPRGRFPLRRFCLPIRPGETCASDALALGFAQPSGTATFEGDAGLPGAPRENEWVGGYGVRFYPIEPFSLDLPPATP